VVKKSTKPDKPGSNDMGYEAGYDAGYAAVRELVESLSRGRDLNRSAFSEGFIDSLNDHIRRRQTNNVLVAWLKKLDEQGPVPTED